MTAGATWSGEAPAKVNLRLRVLERESSGYHRLETVLQALALADRIELTPRSDDRVVIDVRGVAPGDLGPDDQNLAVRAARLFRATAGSSRSFPAGGVEIRLEKRIPHGAGLGGGSSDAATVLRGLNELAGEPLSRARLMELGGELGSDVPFFVSGASRALGLGRGERVVPLPALPARDVLLVVPREPIATGWAYDALDEYRGGGHPASAERTGEDIACEAAGTDWRAVGAAAINDFEEALHPRRPQLRHIKELLLAEGAVPALLTGSGSAVFGVFESEDALARAERRITDERSPGLRALRTRTL